MQIFERVLWRILRGNLYMNFAEIHDDIIDPTDINKKVQKNVFAIFAHGQEVINKIKKITESMGGTLYTVDDASDKRREAFAEVTSRIQDMDVVSITNETSLDIFIYISLHFRYSLKPTILARMSYSMLLITSVLGLPLFVKKRVFIIP